MRKSALTALLALLLGATLDGGWSLEDMMRVKGPIHVQPSPDGERVVYDAMDVAMEWPQADVPSRIYLYEGGKSRSLGLGRLPKWSPDGNWIAYLDLEGRLWKMAPDGGGRERLTKPTMQVMEFAWAPDSAAVALVIGELARSPQGARRDQLWIVTLKEKKPKRLTKGPFHVGSYLFDDNLSWSPDGKEIAFSRLPRHDPDLWNESTIAKVNVDTLEVTQLAEAPSVAPFYSPDGKWIVYVKGEPKSWAMTSDLYLIDIEGFKNRRLSETPNRDAAWSGSLFGWSADSKWVYVLEASGVGMEVVALPIAEGQMKKLPLDRRIIDEPVLSPSRKWLGFVSESGSTPPEAYVASLDHHEIVQVSHLNASLPLEQIAHTEPVLWKGSGDVMIEGLLTYPLNYEKGRRYPLLVQLHGGPAYFFDDEFIGNPRHYPIATFASEGFAVLRCNLRGSTGYGREFRTSIYEDWGGVDLSDLKHGIEHVVSLGVADQEALGLMGWSYGGYLTAWTITQTNIFSAASVGAGIINLVSFTGTTDIPSFIPDYLGSELWENYSLYLERSAITHVDAIETPTLILHGRSDTRVPLSQSYELFRALKRRGVPTELVIYPNTDHAIGNPKYLVDAARRNLAWFGKYVGKKP